RRAPGSGPRRRGRPAGRLVRRRTVAPHGSGRPPRPGKTLRTNAPAQHARRPWTPSDNGSGVIEGRPQSLSTQRIVTVQPAPGGARGLCRLAGFLAREDPFLRCSSAGTFLALPRFALLERWDLRCATALRAA